MMGKSQNRKGIIVLLIFLALFGGFLYILLGDSPISSAIKELSKCSNIAEVKTTYLSCKDQKVKDNEVYLKSVRDKIISFNPTEIQINECTSWLPPRPVSINLIVVPDFSNRVTNTLNCPHQIEMDKEILTGIWSSFKDLTGKKRNSKDRLAIDVTDDGQADGKFRNIANQSIFQLSSADPKMINEFYFDKVGDSFFKLIDSLYKLAAESPISGANYWRYLDQSLRSSHFQQSTIYDEIQNKVIFITDGYLEFNHGENLTNINLNPKEHPINSCTTDYSDWSILVCEVRERNSDKGKDTYHILKTYWQDWLKKMRFKNVGEDFFIESNAATKITNEKIRTFLGGVQSSTKATSEATPNPVVSQGEESNSDFNKDLHSLISNSTNLSPVEKDKSIDDLKAKCGVTEIIVDDGGPINKSLRSFLSTKSAEKYNIQVMPIQGKILKIKVTKL